ncbi:DUF2188 domain-containing protein [Profundibacterium mesophilum]|uniref:DUF2188 domain-containing protein n=1 Tax=Profundibacterium mesophilum KAUST100406-0324 TaxID=1037889 RepID=A0A921NPQ0_9RHOB|nr:DUF2188 domain-containing protein [Profundibacterium mesophilum]KAF0675652.1 uncharacterized protein PMES_01986 [Profundibacterium mesophilum KAUST100406-0324]
MSNLRKFTLVPEQDGPGWLLREDESGTQIHRFDNKEDATAGGALESVLPDGRGSVKIQKEDGTYGEERTFPRSADPARSPG